MWGILFSIIAGAAMSFQGVINTRLSDKIGLFESNAWVQGTAFALALAVCLIWGKGNFASIRETPWIYWTGGVFGIIITVTVMLSIGSLSPTWGISVILTSQLFTAAVIDAFGLLGSDKVAFSWTTWLGLALMTGGVLLIKLAQNRG